MRMKLYHLEPGTLFLWSDDPNNTLNLRTAVGFIQLDNWIHYSSGEKDLEAAVLPLTEHPDLVTVPLKEVEDLVERRWEVHNMISTVQNELLDADSY